jgi:glycosyltransferase involved in cell wall biosynthesis
MSNQNKNLVVVPAYNEEGSLPDTIAKLQALPEDFELLVVNDGSTDFTSQLAHELTATSRLVMHVVDLPLNGGIGAAVQTGYLFAAAAQKYDYVIQFDADGQHDVGSIVALVEACERNDWDLCIGSRFLPQEADGFQSTFPRRMGIRFLSALIRLLSGVGVTDPTSGFRCAGPRAWMDFAQQYPDDYPEPESLYWCLRNRLRVGEIPVVMFARQQGVSSIGSLRAVYYMVKVTLAILIDGLRPKEDPLT